MFTLWTDHLPSVPDPRPPTPNPFSLLDIEPEVNYVAVLNDVLFAFQSELALLAAAGLAPQLDQILEADNFSSYETALDVGMNRARGAVRGRPAPYRPRAALVFTRSQKAYQIEQAISGADEPVARRVCYSEVLKKLALLVFVKLGYLHLDFARHRNQAQVLSPRKLARVGRNLCGNLLFAHVDEQKQRLEAQKAKSRNQRQLFRREFHVAQRRLFFESFFQPVEQLSLARRVFLLFQPIDPVLDLQQVCKNHLVVKCADVARGVCCLQQHGVVESAHYVNERLDFAH